MDTNVDFQKELYIRADMNEVIATGHIMRCLSVADFAREMGIHATFILADDSACVIVNERGYDTIVLNTKWDDLDAEIPLMEQLISDRKIEHLLVDSYSATDEYLRRLSKVTSVSYFDDINDKEYPADILIAYDGCWDEREYRASHSTSKVLWGYDYVPLRKEFSKPSNRVFSSKAKSLLILSGGADIKHAVKSILNQDWIKDFSTVTAICGKLNADFSELSEKYRDSQNIIIKSGVDNISDYMRDADICISACGNTVYELMSCGTPTIVYAMNETQIESAKTLELKEAVLFAGCIESQTFWSDLEKCVSSLFNNSSKRFDLSVTGNELVDGKGAERIARAIIE